MSEACHIKINSGLLLGMKVPSQCVRKMCSLAKNNKNCNNEPSSAPTNVRMKQVQTMMRLVAMSSALAVSNISFHQ